MQKDEGMRILAEQLGITEWRQGLYKDVPLDTFQDDAQNYRNGTAQ